MPTPDERKQAISFIRECRQCHVDWKRFQETDAEWEEKIEPGDVGDAQHHQGWVEKYDLVLRVLADSGVNSDDAQALAL